LAAGWQAGSSEASSRNATIAARRRTQLADMFNALPQILGT
jgi:hypothetical protein